MNHPSRQGAHRRLNRWVVRGSLAMGVALVACAAPSTEQSVGVASLDLRATSAEGNTYRLRDAEFQIGTQDELVETVSSETDPDAESIEVSLDPGPYLVELLDGWRLERSDPGGWADVQAELVPPNVVSVNVASGETVEVVFRFLTDGTIISTGNGTLEIGIEVLECTCDDDNACTEDSCDTADGACNHTALPDGTSCDAGGAPGACFLGTCRLANRSDIALCGEGNCNRYDSGTGELVGPFFEGEETSTYRAFLPNGEMWHGFRLPFGANFKLRRYLPDGSASTSVEYSFLAEHPYLAGTQAGNLYLAGRNEYSQGGIWKVSRDGSIEKIVDTEPACGRYDAVYSLPPDPNDPDNNELLAFRAPNLFRLDMSDEDGDGVYCTGVAADLTEVNTIYGGWVNFRMAPNGAVFVLIGDHSVPTAGLHRIQDGQSTLLRQNLINDEIADFAVGPEDGLLYVLLAPQGAGSPTRRVVRLDPVTGAQLGEFQALTTKAATLDFFPQ